MSHSSEDHLRAALGLKRLSPRWAKAEIFIGLACVWLSFHVAGILGGSADSFGNAIISLPLFVFGGYLAMAGSRSHLYQSNNKLIAFLSDQIRQSKPSA
jgi:hypothetical protein